MGETAQTLGELATIQSAMKIIANKHGEITRLRAELAAERERGKKAWEDGRDAAAMAAILARFGPPSMCPPSGPAAWHLVRDCTPAEAAMHDNGCVDSFKAILSLTPPSEPGSTGGGT